MTGFAYGNPVIMTCQYMPSLASPIAHHIVYEKVVNRLKRCELRNRSSSVVWMNYK